MSKRKQLERELADAQAENTRLHRRLLESEWRARDLHRNTRRPCDDDCLPTPRVELRMTHEAWSSALRPHALRATIALVWHDKATNLHVTTPLHVEEFDMAKPEPLSVENTDLLYNRAIALAQHLRVRCFAINIQGEEREVEMPSEPALPSATPLRRAQITLVLEDWVSKDNGLSLMGSEFGDSLERECIERDAHFVILGLVGSDAEMEVLRRLQDASDAGAEPLFTLRAPEIMG